MSATLIVPPRILSMITGVRAARISGFKCQLEYVDGSHEEATLTADEIIKGQEAFLSLVGSVQRKRGAS